MWSNSEIIRIGSRDSKLAIIQAQIVQEKLKQIGIGSEIVKIKSEGDINLKQPLYEMGITGIFTKSLDIALLNNKIHIAVHSLKDVPTTLPKGIIQSAVLKRGSSKDVFISNKNSNVCNKVGTSSLRRKYFWLDKYYDDNIVNIRGNILSRIKKLNESNWKGIILSKSGLENLKILNELNWCELNWMINAPGQGAIMVAQRKNEWELRKVMNKINHLKTQIETSLEKKILQKLGGGCSSPIGVYAKINNPIIEVKVAQYSKDENTVVKSYKKINLRDFICNKQDLI